MSLTLLYRGKNVRFSMQLNKLHWLTALLSFSVLSGVIIHLLVSANKHTNITLSGIDKYQLVADASKESPLEHKQNNEALTALTIKLAELQSQFLRLNALGDRLANDADIPQKEFDFTQLPPSGGPVLGNEKFTVKSLKELSRDIDLF